MADPGSRSRAGAYGCVTYTPFGFGGGACVDQYGRIYPQFAMGTPGPLPSASFGVASDLDQNLTGSSIGVSGGGGPSLRYHVGGNAASAGGGFSIGPPAVTATYGLRGFTLGDAATALSRLPSLLYPSEPQRYDPVYPLP